MLEERQNSASGRARTASWAHWVRFTTLYNHPLYGNASLDPEYADFAAAFLPYLLSAEDAAIASRKASTVQQIASHVGLSFKAKNLPNPFAAVHNSKAADFMKTELKRAEETRRMSAIPFSALRKAEPHLAHEDWPVWATAVLIWLMCARVSEVCGTPDETGKRRGLRRDQATITDDGVRFSLGRTKTQKPGTKIVLCAVEGSTCPRVIVRLFLDRPGATGGDPLCAHQSGRPVSPAQVADFAKEVGRQFVTDEPQVFGSHSLRVGCFNAMLDHGYDFAFASEYGRWASSCANVYRRYSVSGAALNRRRAPEDDNVTRVLQGPLRREINMESRVGPQPSGLGGS